MIRRCNFVSIVETLAKLKQHMSIKHWEIIQIKDTLDGIDRVLTHPTGEGSSQCTITEIQ